MDNLISLWASSGLAQVSGGQAVMMLVGFGLLYLAISRGFEPLLLVPGILANTVPKPIGPSSNGSKPRLIAKNRRPKPTSIITA